MKFWISLLLLASLPAFASPKVSAFKKFDDAYRQRRDLARFQFALQGFRKLYGEQPDSAEAAWRVAMACTYLGLRVEQDEEAITGAFNEGRMAAFHAIAKDPNCVPCHFWRAVNQVLYARRVGVMRMLFSLKDIRNHFRFVAEHEPTFLSGASLRFLGLIDWKLPGILGGDDDRAREHFEASLKYGPDDPMNYETYYEFLVDQGETENATALLRRALRLTEPASERVESSDALERLKRLTKLQFAPAKS